MIQVYSRNRQKQAILENAYGISERRDARGLDYLEFIMPKDDDKNEYCKPYNYVSYDNGGLYRIVEHADGISDNLETRYSCEHVFGVLINSIMQGEHILDETTIRDAIQYILSKQVETYWVLGDCDIIMTSNFRLTNVTTLQALRNVVQFVQDDFVWRFDTSVFPFVLHLKRVNKASIPAYYIKLGNNLISKTDSANYNICTRLYVRSGELTIEEVNNGLPYLQSPPAIIAQYGIIEQEWTPNGYENVDELKAHGQIILERRQKPVIETDIEFAHFREYGKLPELGDVVDIDGRREIITGLDYRYDNILQSRITTTERPRDLFATLAKSRQDADAAYFSFYLSLSAANRRINDVSIIVDDLIEIIDDIPLDDIIEMIDDWTEFQDDWDELLVNFDDLLQDWEMFYPEWEQYIPDIRNFDFDLTDVWEAIEEVIEEVEEVVDTVDTVKTDVETVKDDVITVKDDVTTAQTDIQTNKDDIEELFRLIEDCGGGGSSSRPPGEFIGTEGFIIWDDRDGEIPYDDLMEVPDNWVIVHINPDVDITFGMTVYEVAQAGGWAGTAQEFMDALGGIQGLIDGLGDIRAVLESIV